MTTNQLEKKRMTAIPMMEVRQMEIQVNLLLESQGPSLTLKEKETARKICLAWLKKNGLPAEEDGEQVLSQSNQ